MNTQLRVDDGELVDADFAGAHRCPKLADASRARSPSVYALRDAAEAWNGKIVLQVAWHSLKYNSMTS